MTAPSPDTVRAALLLTNRLVRLDASPLTAREFWALADRVDVAKLLGAARETIARLADCDAEEAMRLRALLDAATAFGFEQERLADSGIELVSALDARFPQRLRERLGTACPTFLLVAGPLDLLDGDALGVVGSRDADEPALDVARRAGRLAAEHGWPIVSGLARGVDQAAMTAAVDAGGRSIGVPPEGIQRAARNADVRRQVHAGELCLASPYAPDAHFSAGAAMGRNKIIYALSNVTLVVATDNGTGGTWGGATEAIAQRYAPVAVWSGEGAGPGNAALARRGATPVTNFDQLVTTEFSLPPVAEQDSLF